VFALTMSAGPMTHWASRAMTASHHSTSGLGRPTEKKIIAAEPSDGSAKLDPFAASGAPNPISSVDGDISLPNARADFHRRLWMSKTKIEIRET